MTLTFADRYENLHHAASISHEGTAVEFGVHSGRTLSVIRERHIGPVLGFDSFKGLPETWRQGFEQGHFATTRIPIVENTSIIVGLFQDTVPGILASITEPITLAHFDADLYSSTSFALEHITPHIGQRCIFIFDEYENYPGWEEHEHLAFQQWQEEHQNFTVSPISRVPSHEQFTFEIVRR